MLTLGQLERHLLAAADILDTMDDRWDQLVLDLQVLASEAKGNYEALGHGLDDDLHGPFVRLLRRAHDEHPAGGWDGGDVTGALAGLTRDVVARLQNGVRPVGFMTNPVKQEHVRQSLRVVLADSDLFDFEATAQLSTQLLELGRHREPMLRAAS